MTPRERYLKTILFDKPDRVPFTPGGPRESTLKAWHQQGLPEGANYFAALLDELGIAPEPVRPQPGLAVSFKMIPEFEEKILERRNGACVVQDWMGAIVEISDTYDYTYLRYPKDFVTRKWHKFPVENRDDWQKMKQRYDPATPGRLPDDLDDVCAQLRDRDSPVGIQFNGPFWQLREWVGFEGLCRLMIDDPDFVQEMMRFWTEFVSQTMAPVLERVALDRVGISEDMAYKAHSMISPGMTREFLMPAYVRWVDEIKTSGCTIIDMDSDGYIAELIPIWIESGINCCDPVEVAAHNDIIEYRRTFGRRMAYTGGIDKRAIARGGEAIETELMRVVPPLLAGGGFIPGCDHGVPPDVSWPNFVEYSRRLAQLTGWL
jgi:uroporphyrinogen-III decarboxylase